MTFANSELLDTINNRACKVLCRWAAALRRARLSSRKRDPKHTHRLRPAWHIRPSTETGWAILSAVGEDCCSRRDWIVHNRHRSVPFGPVGLTRETARRDRPTVSRRVLLRGWFFIAAHRAERADALAFSVFRQLDARIPPSNGSLTYVVYPCGNCRRYDRVVRQLVKTTDNLGNGLDLGASPSFGFVLARHRYGLAVLRWPQDEPRGARCR